MSRETFIVSMELAPEDKANAKNPAQKIDVYTHHLKACVMEGQDYCRIFFDNGLHFRVTAASYLKAQQAAAGFGMMRRLGGSHG